MSDVKISQLPEATSAGPNDVVPVVDTAGPTTKKIKVSNLPVSSATQTALDAKANSADVYTKEEVNQKIKRVKKSFKIQLDTPTPSPVINPGASHTYTLNLGEEFEQLAITRFEWVVPSLDPSVPETVLGAASFPKDVYGPVLIVNKSPGGWVRNFQIDASEYQGGLPTDVDAVFGADSSEVDAPLGYGSSSLQVPLDHTALQTPTPKKLQIEDAYLDGTNLKIVIKNYDSVPIDLSPYVGITALFDGNRTTDLGSVSDSGIIAYTGRSSTFLRLSEDGGESFKTIHIPKNAPSDQDNTVRSIASMSLSNDGANAFLALFNYAYIITGQSPDYTLTQKYPVRPSLPTFSLSQWGGVYGGDSFQMLGKQLDWKKTSSESCMLFAGFLNYYAMVVYKSVDDGETFGNNAPDYDNNSFIFNAGEMPIGTPNSKLSDYQNAGHYRWQKLEPRAINQNLHYVSISYNAKPELLNNGYPTSNVYLGSQILIGIDSIPFEIRDSEACFTMPPVFNSALGTIKISNSTEGNDGNKNSNSFSLATLPVYYSGSQTVGVEGTVINANELAVLESDFATWGAVVGDSLQTENFSTGRILGVRDAVIDSVNYKLISTGRFEGNSVQYFNLGVYSNGGSPIFGAFAQVTVSFREIILGGVTYYIYPTSSTFATEEFTSNPDLRLVFVMTTEIQKSAVMKTTDGGATWSSICDHDEMRYSPAHAFYSSNDGQTLMLAVMKYGNSPAYEKWPYPVNPSNFGSDIRFNMSTDGGATWRNPSGSWDLLGINGLNYYGGQRQIGQLLGKINNEILAITINVDGVPVLRRSVDDGVTWSSPVPIASGSGLGGYSVMHNDSKQQFMGFFGNLYQAGIGNQNLLYYGSVVSKYTQWQTYGAK